MMQEAQFIQSIEQILSEGRAAVGMARPSRHQQTEVAGFVHDPVVDPVASKVVVTAVHACLLRLEPFLLEQGPHQDARVIRTAKREVTAFIHDCVVGCAAATRQELPPNAHGSASGYSQIEQLQDRIEAEADVMFHRLAVQRVRLRNKAHSWT